MPNFLHSIKTKLTLLITIVITAISLFVYLYIPQKIKERQLNAFADKVNTIAEITSYSIGAAILFEDLETTYEQIYPLLTSDEIEYLIIHTKNDGIFFEHNLLFARDCNYKISKSNPITENNSTFKAMSKITVNGEVLGQLYIGYSLANLKTEVSNIKSNIGQVSLIIFFVGALSVFYIALILIKPLTLMVEVAEKIKAGNLSIRAQVVNNDEIGYLAKSFNSMIERIETTNEELEWINKELEQRVLERTKELTESEERFRGLYENSTIGIYRITPNNKIILANPALVKMLGHGSQEELLKRENGANGYVDPNGRKKFLVAIEENGVVKSLEQKWKKTDGSIIFISESARAVKDENGDILYYDGTVEDITAKKVIEEELIKAKEKAESSVKMKTEFLAQMSHEIRTPINSILSYTQLLKDETFDLIPKDLQFSFDMINNGGRRLIRTVDLILNMSEMQTGTYEAIIEECNIVILLNELVGEFQTAAKSKHLALMMLNRLDFEDSVLKTDIYTVTQIFANLIDNAIKYTVEGSIEIIAFKTKDDYLCVDVQDTGIGISQKFQETLFDPFTQEEQGYTRKFDGNGLGMALVKEYCKLNNASISVSNTKGKGTTFSVIFPHNSITKISKANEIVALR